MQIEQRRFDSGARQITGPSSRWYFKNENLAEPYPSVTWIGDSWPKGKQFMDWVGRLGTAAATEYRDYRAQQGSAVHQAVERLIHNHVTGSTEEVEAGTEYYTTSSRYPVVLDESGWYAVRTFKLWWKHRKPEVISYEEPEFYGPDSEGRMWAGSPDLRCKIGKNTWTIDFKTGKNIVIPNRLQLTAYQQFEGREKDKLMALQLGYGKNKRGWKETVCYPMLKEWYAVYDIWRFLNPVRAPKAYEIPQSLKLGG